MTALERRKTEMNKDTLKRRIAAGAGVQVQEVKRLLNKFEQMHGMMKMMGQMSGMMDACNKMMQSVARDPGSHSTLPRESPPAKAQ